MQTTQKAAMPRYQKKTFTPLEGLLQSIQLEPGNDYKGRRAVLAEANEWLILERNIPLLSLGHLSPSHF
jgi:hypothetical protein